MTEKHDLGLADTRSHGHNSMSFTALLGVENRFHSGKHLILIEVQHWNSWIHSCMEDVLVSHCRTLDSANGPTSEKVGKDIFTVEKGREYS